VIFQYLSAMFVLPASCPVCRTPGEAPCLLCRAGLVRLGATVDIAGLEAFAAPFRYEGGARLLIAALKYRGNRAALGWLSEEMAAVAPVAHDDSGRAPLVVTWAPTSPRRRRERGFDQAELLARAVARRLGAPCRGILRRGPGPPLTGRAWEERHGQVRFVVARRCPEPVLVVDDVVTTGTTMAAAGAALRAAGAGPVVGLAAAWTPPPGDPGWHRSARRGR
jgi:predicted amidophosphoribosyltransferase